MSERRDHRAQVRIDVRAFGAGASLAVLAAVALVLWRTGVVDGTTGRNLCGALAALAVVVAAAGWFSGDRRIPDRLFVLGPAFLAAVPLALAIDSAAGPGPAFLVSFALALAAVAAFVVRRRR